MDLTNLQNILEETFAGNFVLYYRTHQSHVNIRGRNFYSDHKLLQKIYEDLQDHIDSIGEKLRACDTYMPMDLAQIIETSPITDMPITGTSLDILEGVLDGILQLIDVYHDLEAAADAVNYTDVTNMAQDHIGVLAKWKWQLDSTIGLRLADED